MHVFRVVFNFKAMTDEFCLLLSSFAGCGVM